METVISKWGNSSAVRLPKPYLKKLGIENNDTVKVSVQGNVITIEKVLKTPSFREMALTEAGLSLEDYVLKNPYDIADYVECGRVGSEEI